MKNKKLLLFDYDGVIVDSLDIIFQILVNLKTKYDLPIIETKKDVGKLLEKNFFETLSTYGFTAQKAQELLTEIKHQKQNYAHQLQLFSGMYDLIKRVSSEFPCIIVTSTHEDVVKDFLMKNSLLECFNLILGGNREPSKVKKITYALDYFHTIKDHAYFISDTTGDIEEGNDVGVNTIAVTWGFHNKKELTQSSPQFLFTQVEKLEDFLLNL